MTTTVANRKSFVVSFVAFSRRRKTFICQMNKNQSLIIVFTDENDEVQLFPSTDGK